MKAIILAAGKATRLLPFTKDSPQCLLKIGQKTILERQIEFLKKGGIEEITIITGYLSEKIEKISNSLAIKTLFNPFYDVSGMALTLWIAKEELKRGFIFLYSDILLDPKLVKGLLENRGDICLAIKKDGIREEAEKVIEKDGYLESISKIKRSRENGEFVGIAKFSEIGAKKLIVELDRIAEININSSFIDVIEGLINKNERINTYDIKNMQFVDIDFPADLKKAEELFK